MSTHPALVLAERHTAAGPKRVCLNLLGGPYVSADGCRTEIPEGSKRLLAFVALNQGPVERRRAAGTLWPESDDVRAAGNLRSALWRLKGMGVDLLQCDKVALWLRPGTVVDVTVVTDWAERIIAGRPEAQDLAPMVWRLDFVELLPGWYEDWALLERERVRQVLLHALEALARRLITDLRAAEAVVVAMTAASIEPLRESAQRVLIEAHLAEGNLVEARRSFGAFCALSQRELGVAPSPALVRLVR